MTIATPITQKGLALEFFLEVRQAAGDQFGRLSQSELISLIETQKTKTGQLNNLFIKLKNKLPLAMQYHITDWNDLEGAVAAMSKEIEQRLEELA